MKTLTIGNTTLALEDFAKKWDKIAGVYAVITIPTSAISRDELNALFKGNQHDLIVTDEDGTITTYSGYSEWNETKENADFYTVIQYCSETALHLLNEARKQINTLEHEKAELQTTVKAQGTELQNHAKIIVLQNEQLTEQTAQVESLTEMSTAQLLAIDGILTNVVPSIIEMAVTQAIEAVTSQETTEE